MAEILIEFVRAHVVDAMVALSAIGVLGGLLFIVRLMFVGWK